MAIVTMTLYEALSKKKVYESKLSKASGGTFCGIKYKHKDICNDNNTVEEENDLIKSNYDKTVAIFNNYVALKAAINEANAKIKIEVGGKEYSIANAIVRQRSIGSEKAIYTKMLNNLTATKREIEYHNNEYLSADNISNYVSRILGDSKKDESIINKLKEDYINDHEYELYDPFNIEELVNKKLDEINLFEEQIHFALTQANCTNTIEVEFED